MKSDEVYDRLLSTDERDAQKKKTDRQTSLLQREIKSFLILLGSPTF